MKSWHLYIPLNAGIAPQVFKSMLPVEDSFSNKEMCTFSHIPAHQSTSETFNTGLPTCDTRTTVVGKGLTGGTQVTSILSQKP